jgi:glutamine amidotransferase
VERVIAIVDYGAGNLRSIDNALRKVCDNSGSTLRTVVSADPAVIGSAAGVVLPGVGAAGPTMARLRSAGLAGPLVEAAATKPFLGICLGMQLLFGYQEEGEVDGLGVLEGTVERLPGDVKLPHVGWNLASMSDHPMFNGIGNEAYFYFVHSYRALPGDANCVQGTVWYGESFCAAISRDRLWATQFHPEKSGQTGLRLLRNYVEMVEMQEVA